MNSGANIVYLGTSLMVRQPGDHISTNEFNRTELSRQYQIQKSNYTYAIEILRKGYKAPDYANLYLLGPPRETVTETFYVFDCTFSGILDPSEGGNGSLYERIEQPQNIASISSTLIYLQPVYRFYYTLRADAESRVLRRDLENPDTVEGRNNSTGTIVRFEGSSFFWEPYDIQRANFDLYDEVVESWRLTYIT